MLCIHLLYHSGPRTVVFCTRFLDPSIAEPAIRTCALTIGLDFGTNIEPYEGPSCTSRDEQGPIDCRAILKWTIDCKIKSHDPPKTGE